MTLRAAYPRLVRQFERPVASLGRIGDHSLFYGKALAGVPFAATHYTREDRPADRRDQHGRGHFGDDRRNRRDRRLFDAGGRRHAGHPGLHLAGQYRHRGADGLSGRVHQRAYRGTGGRRNRFGGHLRRRRDRSAGCHADQRRNRCTGSHGDSAGFLLGQHQDRGGNDGDHAVVQHRRHPVVSSPANSPRRGPVRAVAVVCTTTTSTRS